MAQVCFFLLGVGSATACLAVLDALAPESVVVVTFFLALLTIELGAPWSTRPWWRTKAGLVALVGFVLYVLVLFYRFG